MSDSWDATDYNPPSSSVHGILQVRVLEWIAIPFSSTEQRKMEKNSNLCCYSYKLENSNFNEGQFLNSFMDYVFGVLSIEAQGNIGFHLCYRPRSLSSVFDI